MFFDGNSLDLDHPRFEQRTDRILIYFNFVFAVPQPRRGL
jgi:hypothetical protein